MINFCVYREKHLYVEGLLKNGYLRSELYVYLTCFSVLKVPNIVYSFIYRNFCFQCFQMFYIRFFSNDARGQLVDQ